MNVGQQDVSPPLTAIGTTQATALLLFNGIANIGTAASGSGVILNYTNPGTSQVVYNGGANAVKVYPPVGAQINGLPVNTGHLLSPNTTCVYWFLTSALIAANLSA